MKAIDVMVRDVITIGPDDSIADSAKLIADNDVSALPVVDDDGHLVGIISEGDLMRRAEAGTERRHSWWLGLIAYSLALCGLFTAGCVVMLGIGAVRAHGAALARRVWSST